MIGMALIIVSILVLGIWILVELRKFKHQLWAFFLIALILFGYVSFSLTTKNHDIDYGTFSGLTKALKIYFSWLGGLFGNFRSITSHAISLDWSPNETR
jgi:hypothetical protein